MKRFFYYFFNFCVFCFVIGSIATSVVIYRYNKQLPSIKELKEYNPDLTTRLYTNNGILLKEYATEKRLFVPIDNIPDLVKEAFISAEDSNFYNHLGIDPRALLSAIIHNIKAHFGGGQVRGASTITQQVAKNFLLTNERTLDRKIKEAILSFKITKSISKDKVLELYLNQIFLGYRSYGVAAGALNYFNKSLDDLEIQDAALLAAMPKAPGKLNPKVNYDDALIRRNWVIKRMYEEGYINKSEMLNAQNSPIEIKEKNKDEYFVAGAFVEDVRKKIIDNVGESRLMKDGLVVLTTLDQKIQKIIQNGFKDGIEAYEKRFGYRKPLGNVFIENEKNFKNDWGNELKNFEINSYYRNNWRRAVVLDFDELNNKVEIGLIFDEKNNDSKSEERVIINGTIYSKSYLSLKYNAWAKEPIQDKKEEIKEFAKNVKELNLKVGDIIFVVKMSNDDGYVLRQVPDVNGAVVVLDPHTGKILGMVGGYVDSETTFNRATQANRQVGSIMKPFIYLSAFENGYTPASIVMDEEIILNQGDGLPPYIPKNFESDRFYGPITLRTALQKSCNVSSVRLVYEMGLRKVVEVVKRFNINKRPKAIYSLVLGSVESRLINMTQAYAMLVNGGKQIDVDVVEKIQDKYGKTIYKRDDKICESCVVNDSNINNVIVPELIDNRKTITDAASAYQIVSILEGVIKNGTGWRAKAIGKTLGGKTGTSNDFKDAWFIGFSPDVVVGIYVGYDDNRTLGENETGSKVALPIFVDIMKKIMADKQDVPFRVPDNIEFVKVDSKTGEAPTLITNKLDIIFEAFKKGQKRDNKKINENSFEREIKYIEEDSTGNFNDNLFF